MGIPGFWIPIHLAVSPVSFFRDVLRMARAKVKLDDVLMACVFASLDSEGFVQWDIPWGPNKSGIAVKRGWKPRKDAMRVLKHGCNEPRSVDFWVPEPSRITVSATGSKVAKFLSAALHQMPALRTYHRLEPIGGQGAADACAHGQYAGIGGWWTSGPDPPSVNSIRCSVWN